MSTRTALYSSATDNWPTPQDFYDRLDAEFNFALDVCSSKANHKAPVFYALDHDNPNFRDGLAGDWAADAAGQTIWCNPPYGRGIRAWMEAALHAAQTGGATVVCLVPVRADSAWWHDLVLSTGAEVRYVRGRLKFGDAKNSAAFSSAVVIYRPTDVIGAAGPVHTVPNKLPAPAPAPVTDLDENSSAVPSPTVLHVSLPVAGTSTPRRCDAPAAAGGSSQSPAADGRDVHAASVQLSVEAWFRIREAAAIRARLLAGADPLGVRGGRRGATTVEAQLSRT
ncbi:DNA N-6-adenine-methyltransferase [Aeromicrobium sp. Root472D3]|uniref:DNA N-6-adenine-methyltransferase n=1 Tax=Aeromicrobium sp. Root472D3 TaxID=1736540 RepID=UPI0009E85317|nr:DNA N-6-adenine-methyltransferase [Aeromicrobium sp. Root472D3]